MRGEGLRDLSMQAHNGFTVVAAQFSAGDFSCDVGTCHADASADVDSERAIAQTKPFTWATLPLSWNLAASSSQL